MMGDHFLQITAKSDGGFRIDCNAKSAEAIAAGLEVLARRRSNTLISDLAFPIQQELMRRESRERKEQIR